MGTNDASQANNPSCTEHYETAATMLPNARRDVNNGHTMLTPPNILLFKYFATGLTDLMKWPWNNASDIRNCK